MTIQTAAPTPVTATPWLALGALGLATFATVTTELMPSGVLPTMSRDLGVSTAAGGLLVTAWALTIVLTSLLLVRSTSAVRRRTLVVGAMVVVAAANVGTALAPTFALAIGARIAAAGAHGLFWAVVVAYAASLVDPSKVGRALAVVLAGPTFAGLVGLPAGAAVADAVGWRPLFASLAVVVVVVAAVVWTVVPDAPRSAAPAAATGGWDRSAKPVLLTAIAGGLVLVGHFAVFTFVAPLTAAHVGDGAVPTMLLVLGVGGLVGTLVSGQVVDRWPGAAYPVSAALFVASLAGLALGPTYWVVAAVWGVLVGLFPVALQSRVMAQASPGFRDQAGAIVMTVLNLGLALGAALGSAVTAVADVVAVPLWAAALAALAAVPLAMASRSARDAG
ncbi:putative MFS family arabinose efflux permease [Nocardioides thalensis]|uniref:Putative MFS family arabinose efflux permease n=1 Tax=Nocardioides thalensis TaxID=1914755 RepID=A0A853C291_9ACTN|nr:MFS transporter [Nocardioides thalensis]NYJ01301.1 putative MFS family arabinose efflux permease [Nocardioides thalensis]